MCRSNVAEPLMAVLSVAVNLFCPAYAAILIRLEILWAEEQAKGGKDPSSFITSGFATLSLRIQCSGRACSLARKSGRTIRFSNEQRSRNYLLSGQAQGLGNVAVMSSTQASDWKKINQASLSWGLNGSVTVSPSEVMTTLVVIGDLIFCACAVGSFRSGYLQRWKTLTRSPQIVLTRD